MTPELKNIYAPFSDLSLTKAENALYINFRNMEPHLVSCSDNFSADQKEEVLVLHEKGHPLGMVSVVIRENLHKATPPKSYARLDLVIVSKPYRNLGVGRLLIVSALLFVLRTWEQKIYSISCLAGHKTVEKFLKELSFQDHPRKEKDFWQGTLNLEERSPQDLLDSYLKKAKSCLQWTVYQLDKKEHLCR